jgi:hypothetical protein
MPRGRKPIPVVSMNKRLKKIKSYESISAYLLEDNGGRSSDLSRDELASLRRGQIVKAGSLFIIKSELYTENLERSLSPYLVMADTAKKKRKSVKQKRTKTSKEKRILILNPDFSVKEIWVGRLIDFAKQEDIGYNTLRARMSKNPTFILNKINEANNQKLRSEKIYIYWKDYYKKIKPFINLNIHT